MKELHVYDFDGTLYNSPKPPKPDPSWWLFVKSLGKTGAPGFDVRWNVPMVIQARRSIQDPCAETILLTARPDYNAMRQKVETMLDDASLDFRRVWLKPPFLVQPTPAYKATIVESYLIQDPEFTKVVFYDDDPNNLDAVGRVTQRHGVEFRGIQGL